MKATEKIKQKLKMRTPGEVIGSYVPDIPSGSAAFLTSAIMKLLTADRPARICYEFDRRAMKGRQVLILSQHASRDDPYYVGPGCHFGWPNAIMSLHNVLIPLMYRLLLADGVILKSLYEPDLKAMRHIIRLKKKGASFLLFPEGIQSMDGSTQPIHPATARLIKKLDMDTMLCTSHGAYLCNPRFDTNKRRGRLEYKYEMLCSRDELRDMTEEELYSRLVEKFRYSDFAWNSEKQFRYKGKVPLAHGIDNILFICPRCGRQHSMHVEGDSLICSCGSRVRIDDCYNLIPDDVPDFPFKRIDEWYQWEQDVIAEEVRRDDFRLKYDASYLMLNTKNPGKGRFVPVGEGRIELDHNILRYTGTRKGEAVDLKFEISRLPSLPVTRAMANEFYYDGVYHQFALKNDRRHAVKLLMAVEALHDMGDPERSKARSDVRSRVI